MGDSAFYSGAVKHGGDMKWLSRVPENIKEAKQLLSLKDEDLAWIELDNNYRMQCFDSNYGDEAQRWSLIYSKEAFKKEIKTLEKAIIP